MTVDQYLALAPEPQRSTLSKLRAILRELLPDATEEMSYDVPAFKIDGKAIAGYGAFTKHCSFFPHSGSVLPTLAEELTGYEWSKGTLKFPIDDPPPRQLIAAIVDRRLDQLGLSPTDSRTA